MKLLFQCFYPRLLMNLLSIWALVFLYNLFIYLYKLDDELLGSVFLCFGVYIIAIAFFSATGWHSLWRRESISIRQFWTGQIIFYLGSVLIDLAIFYINYRVFLIYTPKGSFPPLGDVVSSSILAITASLALTRTFKNSNQFSQTNVFSSLLQLVLFYVVLAIVVIGFLLSKVVGFALAEAFLLAWLLMLNPYMKLSLSKGTRIRLLGASVLAVALIMVISLLVLGKAAFSPLSWRLFQRFLS